MLLWFGFRAFYSLWWKPKKLEKQLRQQGIKGSCYKFYYGDMKESMQLIMEALTKPMNLNHHIAPCVFPFTWKTVQTYGRVSFHWNGTTPRLIILDTEMMKDVMTEKNGHIQKPPVECFNPVFGDLPKGITNLEGEKWLKHRRIIKPALNLEKLKGMVPAFRTSCSELIARWKKLTGPAKGSCELDIWPEMQTLTSDIISRTAFGSNYEEGKKLFELQNEQIALFIEASQSIYIPGFRFIPTKKNLRRKQLVKEINGILRRFISRREELMKTDPSSSSDLLGLLLQSNNTENSDRLTIDEVIDECKVFYLVGQETTRSLVTFTIIVLAMHPNWQEKAREEVEQVCGKNVPDFNAINCLKIKEMILNEVMRLYPPGPELYRYTSKTTKLGNLSIPAGVILIVPLILAHHDPEYWGDDSQEFKPERFAEGVSNASNDKLAYFPFSRGHKVCLGQNFALIEAKMALTMIVQNFSFQLSPSYTHVPYVVLDLAPQHGAQIILHQL
ncbi:hypothetical protein C5167_026529 [Papaver somniferum]|uniref:cytochrome P450 CYP72A219-like isoform X2 n=1 Tax=Papaver somniferum TaxID=3469 RepID=UPI000E704CC1|nr:cytochrome P450 CYP72A219-like isoform X2 [Papaver somniferum]RZC85855.1 hypothetical protein C5167_026529 [Papaver somniferum]